jgi:hypothetical protein
LDHAQSIVLGSGGKARLRGGVKILATIAARAAAEGLPFLVIGGNAVIAYGYPRMTRDLDLLVREDDRRAWDELITGLGYTQHQIMRAFHMYNPAERGQFPVDLMLVDAATFAKLTAEPGRCVLDETEVGIPKLSHLLALKLHALRQGPSHRYERDLSDVLILMDVNEVDLAQPEYAEILNRYATPAVRTEILRRLAGPESPGA